MKKCLIGLGLTLVVLGGSVEKGFSQQLLKLNYKSKEVKKASEKFAPKFKGAAATKEDSSDAKTGSIENYSSFLGNFNGLTVLPNVNLLIENVSKPTKSKPEVWGAKVFAAGTKTDSADKSLRLLFVESSKFGFQLNYSRVLFKTKETDGVSSGRLLLLTEASYVGKDFSLSDKESNDTVKFTSHFAHLKSGLELAIVPEMISVFANANMLFPLVERTKFSKLFANDKHQFFFLDVGFVIRANLSGKADTNMYFTLGAVVNNGDLRGLNNNNRDAVFPYARIGANFNLFKFN